MLRPFRQTLRQPHVARLLLTSLWARLPTAMQNLALLLFFAPRLGYGRAGLAVGTIVASGGVSNIWITRLVDRLGPRPVLVPCALSYAATMTGLAASRQAPYLLILGLCALTGIILPPVTSIARSTYSAILPPEVVRSVFSLEATAQELVYIVGPTGVALVAGLSSARIAVLVTGFFGCAGALVFAATPVLGRTADEPRPPRQRILGSGVLRYAGVGLALITAFAMVEIAVVAIVGGPKSATTAGLVLAGWSVGSMLGGLAYAQSKATVTDRGLTTSLIAVAASIAVTAAAPGAIALAVLLLAGGTTVAPCLAMVYTRVGDVAPTGSSTESFGWLSAAFLVGGSAGSSAGGLSVDAIGGHWTMLIAAGAVLTAVLLLRPRPVASLRGRRQAPHPDVA